MAKHSSGAQTREPAPVAVSAGSGARRGSIQVIARAASILRALKHTSNGMSLGQIATHVHLPRSTVQRIVDSLLEEGLVMSAGPVGGFRLGPEIQSLARFGKIDVVEAVRPLIVALSQQTGETVDLSVLRSRQMLFLDQISGTHRLRAVSAIGDVFPLTVSSNGKSCLALLDDEAAETLIRAELADTKGKTGSRTVSDVLAELAEIRRTGIAFNLDEHTIGISAVGIGFIDTAGARYSISVPIPSARFSSAKAGVIARLLRIRAELGLRPHEEASHERPFFGDRLAHCDG
ncbi:MAG: IclR family transcriptional regulator [Rhizobiaceae bacterium]|nr:IclR family transcriptional regulator [Rhizobiaceae bacterium]